jgi:hypothetical protein
MFKDLLTAPLEHAMVLLWCLGIINIVHFPFKEGSFSWSWIASAACAALLTMLLAARLRKPLLVSLAVILGLCTVLAIAYRAVGVSTLSFYGGITAGYALVGWLFAIWLLAYPSVKQVLERLKLLGGYGDKSGGRAVETVIHWCCFAIAILAIFAGIMHKDLPGSIPSAPLVIVGAVMLFLLMSGRRYHSKLHSYLFIGLGVWSVLTFFTMSSWGASVSTTTLSIVETWQGLVLAIFGLVLLSAGGWLLRPLLEEENIQDRLQEYFYVRPLLNSAVVCVTFAATQGIALTLLERFEGKQWTALASCAIAGFVLLAVSHILRHSVLAFAGVGLVSLTLLWLYSVVVYGDFPLRFQFGGAAIADQWLLVSVLGFVLACLVRYVTTSRWQETFEQPIFIMALLLYVLGCFGAITLYMDVSVWIPFLPLILFVLLCTLFPLPHRLSSNSGNIRGIGIACLLSLLVVSVLGSFGLERQAFAVFLCAWAYIMWAISNLLLPRWNSRFSQWTVVAESWPWLGLLAMGIGLSLASQPVFLQWDFTLILSGFFFLMMRNSVIPIFRWLTVISLTWSGLIFSGMRYLQWGTEVSLASFPLLAMENLLWINILLLTVPWFRLNGAEYFKRWQWRQTELAGTIQTCCLGICCAWLVALAAWELGILFFDFGIGTLNIADVLLGGMLTLSFLHGLWWSRLTVLIHPLLAALSCTLLAGWEIFNPFHLSILLALWSVLLLAGEWLQTRYESSDISQSLALSTKLWLQYSLVATLAVTCFPGVPDLERLITLVIWSVTVTIFGCRTRSKIWLTGAALVLVVLIHGVWFIPFEFGRLLQLFPWFACELALLAWALKWLSVTITGRDKQAISPWQIVGDVLAQGIPFIILLALVEWGIHFFNVISILQAGEKLHWLFAYGDPFVALLAIGLIVLWALPFTKGKRNAPWIYGIAFLVSFAAVYVRILLLGLAPFCLWDSAAMMAAAYGLLVVQHFVPSRALLNIILTLPLFSLISIFLQRDPVLSSIALLIAGVLYIFVQRKTEKKMFLNLGLLAFNGAIYLWVPGLVAELGLLQIYLIPAAATVLLLTHLHRHELKVTVLNGTRLAALSILYSAVTLDVFLVDSLLVFALALVLSLVGIVVGIALHIRAFFYTGTAFLVVNVFGQLLQLYPEQRLGRAILLMGLGAIITGSMIWFNMKREMILQKIRIYRADLESWE